MVTTVNEIKVGELCVLREAFVIWQIVSCIKLNSERNRGKRGKRWKKLNYEEKRRIKKKVPKDFEFKKNINNNKAKRAKNDIETWNVMGSSLDVRLSDN